MPIRPGFGGTFDFVTLYSSLKLGNLVISGTAGTLLFMAFAIAFAIKVPLFPFHTWLPDAHTEAPTAGSVILAAVLLKMGTYGLMRFNFTLFPDQSREFAWIFITLAIIGIIYGALVAMVQPDIKRLVAYSSVAHMGFVILGMFSFTEWGMQGAVYQMLNHGVSTGALFLLVGFIYERRHTREISQFGGLANVMPIYATIFVITSMSSVGLPFPEWICGRIFDHGRDVQIAGFVDNCHDELELCGDDARGNGRDLRGSISAMDDPTGFLWQGNQREE